jgi:amidase
VANEIWSLDATDVAKGIRAGKFSSVDAVNSVLDRLDEVNPRLNAVVDVMADYARTQAKAADMARAAGKPIGPLHGVPVTVKVNTDFEGRATTNGVPLLKDNVAVEDASSVRAWKSAGAIIIGRTNTPSFSLRCQTDNDLYGLTRNPWHKDITPAGTSGGAAAAIAAGVAPIGQGTDIVGSTRLPAYNCGIFGIRPSLGRVGFYSRSVGDPTIAAQLVDVQGMMARSVRDLRLGINAMSLHDPRDPWQVPVAPISDQSNKPRRAAVWLSNFPLELDTEVHESLQRAAGWLEEAGYEVVDVHPGDAEEAWDMWTTLVMGENRENLLHVVEQYGDAEIKTWIAGCYEVTPSLDLPLFLKLLVRRTELMRNWHKFLGEYPILVMPTSQRKPALIGSDATSTEAAKAAYLAMSPTKLTSVLNLPSVCAPTGPINGLPGGVQIVGLPFCEADLFAAAEVIEMRAPKVVPINPSWT